MENHLFLMGKSSIDGHVRQLCWNDYNKNDHEGIYSPEDKQEDSLKTNMVSPGKLKDTNDAFSKYLC